MAGLRAALGVVGAALGEAWRAFDAAMAPWVPVMVGGLLIVGVDAAVTYAWRLGII